MVEKKTLFGKSRSVEFTHRFHYDFMGEVTIFIKVEIYYRYYKCVILFRVIVFIL